MSCERGVPHAPQLLERCGDGQRAFCALAWEYKFTRAPCFVRLLRRVERRGAAEKIESDGSSRRYDYW